MDDAAEPIPPIQQHRVYAESIEGYLRSDDDLSAIDNVPNLVQPQQWHRVPPFVQSAAGQTVERCSPWNITKNKGHFADRLVVRLLRRTRNVDQYADSRPLTPIFGVQFAEKEVPSSSGTLLDSADAATAPLLQGRAQKEPHKEQRSTKCQFVGRFERIKSTVGGQSSSDSKRCRDDGEEPVPEVRGKVICPSTDCAHCAVTGNAVHGQQCPVQWECAIISGH